LLLINPSFWISKEDKKNISYEIVFWIDNSLSMLAKDWEEKNRFNRWKDLISWILNSINWNFWLIEFSWESFISIPLTSDKNSFLTILKKTEINKKWNFSKSWTNFNSIKKNISKIFDLKKNKEKILILISDWENLSNDFSEDFWKNNLDFPFFNKNKIHILTVWFWSLKLDKNWDLIWSKIELWEDKNWKKIFKTYENEEVFSKINENFLTNISKKTWWKYFYEKKVWDNWEKIINFIKNNFEKKIILEKEIKEKKYFQFFAFLIFLLFLIDIFLNKNIIKKILKYNKKK